MSNTLHLIWIGGALRDEEVDSVRAIISAAYAQKVPIQFFVDNKSIHSVTGLLNGLLGTSSKLKIYNLDPSFNFLKSNMVSLINIDTDLDAYLDDFINAPAISVALKSIFGDYDSNEVKELILKIIRLERTGAYKNLASVSDILRAIALIKNGGYYCDPDVELQRNPRTFTVLGQLPVPDTFKINMRHPQGSFNNDIFAANPYNQEYILFFVHIMHQYMNYLAQDSFFYKTDKQNGSDAYTKSGYSLFTHKRQLLRFSETHRTTGNLFLSYFFSFRNLYKPEHTLSGTLFSDAKSLSTITWRDTQIKNSDDSDIGLQLSSNNLEYAKEKPVYMKRLKSFFKPEIYTFACIKRLAILKQTAELAKLVQSQPDETKTLLSKLILEIYKDFCWMIDGFIIRYNNQTSTNLSWNYVPELFDCIWSVASVQKTFDFSILNSQGEIAMYGILTCLNDLKESIADKSNYETEFWLYLADAFAWYVTHLDPKTKARAYIMRNIFYGYPYLDSAFNAKMFRGIYMDNPEHYTFDSEFARTLFLLSFINYDINEEYIEKFRQLAADSKELEQVRDFSCSLNRTKYMEQFEEEIDHNFNQ